MATKPPSTESPRMRRWDEQRWVLDDVIRANGVDWDQPRSIYWNVPCGMEAGSDFARIRQTVHKYTDIVTAFAAAARRREGKARVAEQEGNLVSARDNYFIAAIHWGAAQWPIDADTPFNLQMNRSKRDCYASYARLSDRRVEEVWIPFKGARIPAWFHLPPGYRGGRLPTVISVPGMDNFKEASVALYGDRWLNRGMAVLAIDGPGQYEAIHEGLHVSMENWIEVGPVLVDWLVRRKEVDRDRIGVAGTSFGTFFATIIAANEPRLKACALNLTTLEPGFHAIFQEASPTFKKRFMYMAGIPDEDEFDRFRQTLTWEGHAEKIRIPFLALGGEVDETCPLEATERLFATLTCPKQLVIYQDAKHPINAVPSATLGPLHTVLMADWMAQRLAGKPMKSERWFVDATGRVEKSPFAGPTRKAARKPANRNRR